MNIQTHANPRQLTNEASRVMLNIEMNRPTLEQTIQRNISATLALNDDKLTTNPTTIRYVINMTNTQEYLGLNAQILTQIRLEIREVETNSSVLHLLQSLIEELGESLINNLAHLTLPQTNDDLDQTTLVKTEKFGILLRNRNGSPLLTNPHSLEERHRLINNHFNITNNKESKRLFKSFFTICLKLVGIDCNKNHNIYIMVCLTKQEMEEEQNEFW